MRQRFAPGLAALCLMILAACGGDEAPYEAGLTAAKAGDHRGAVVQFDKALGELTPDAPEYSEVFLARTESSVHVDPQAAMSDFIDELETNKAAFEPKDYLSVFWWLVEAKSFDQAGTLAAEFKKRNAGNEELASKMDKRIKEAIAKGEIDQSQLDTLKGLGYLGSN